MQETMIQDNSTEAPSSTKRARQLSITSSISSSTSSPSATVFKAGKGGPRKSSSLPTESVEYLKAWMMSPEHIAHPYPTEQEKAQIMADTGIELKQLTNWFVNNRKRYWKPRVEARIHQQSHAAAAVAQVQAAVAAVAAAATQQAAAAVAATNPITPEVGYRPTLHIHANNGFVSFDLCAPSQQQVPAVPPTPRKESLLSDAESLLTMVTPDFSRYMTTSSSSSSLSAHSQLSLHAVSEASTTSSVSASDNESTASSEELAEEQLVDSSSDFTRTETVTVHILRPLSGGKPTLEDVTVLSNVPKERIIKTFHDCAMSYECPSSLEYKKMLNRRDAEIVRIKKQYLKVYLDGLRWSRPSLPAKKRRQEQYAQEEQTLEESSPPSQLQSSPRTKFRRVSFELWRDACHSATNSFHDDSLPTMEEASQLFGYAC